MYTHVYLYGDKFLNPKIPGLRMSGILPSLIWMFDHQDCLLPRYFSAPQLNSQLISRCRLIAITNKNYEEVGKILFVHYPFVREHDLQLDFCFYT